MDFTAQPATLFQDQMQPPLSDQDSLHLLSSKLANLPALSSKCCIYKVPGRIRDENSTAYTPRIVSIGPLHCDKEDLKAMEEQKLHYLNSFLERSKVSLEDFFKFMKEREQKVRDCYAESFEYITSNEFVQMMIVDAAFVVELLWRNYSANKKDMKNDRIFKKPCKVDDVMYDLMLLENQIPFFILEDIFELAKLTVPLSDEKVSLIKLTHSLFEFKAYLGKIDNDLIERVRSSKVKHFVDFFIAWHVPKELLQKGKIQTVTVPSVTDLYKAGGEFEVGQTKSLFDIQFRKGTLAIPHLRIRKSTESFILNLVAFEHCHLLEGYVSSYVFVIDRLVDSTEAVRLLAQSGVIDTTLPDYQEVVASIDKMVRGSVLRRNHFYFNEVCEDLSAYCLNPWNRWYGTLKNKHFSSPLTVFAVVVAVAIFVLTLLQTICSCGVQF